ncbi:MAG TPA: hypothetical protein VGF92_18290, partial [Stellaceae bacterium]
MTPPVFQAAILVEFQSLVKATHALRRLRTRAVLSRTVVDEIERRTVARQPGTNGGRRRRRAAGPQRIFRMMTWSLLGSVTGRSFFT